MRAPTLALVALSLVAASTASAQDSSRRKLANAFRAERRTSVASVDLSTLPQSSTPVPLDDTKKPAVLPGNLTEAPEVQFVSSDPAAMARWKTSKVTTSMYGRVEVAGGKGIVLMARDLQQNQYRGNNFSVNCSNDPGYNNYYRATAIRWERIVGSGDSVSLEVSEGWFDSRACKAFLDHRTSIPLKAVASHEGVPVAFASRSDDGLTFYFPPNTRMVADTSSGATSDTVFGALWRVTVPVRKGQAASLLAELNPTDGAAWMQAAFGKPPEPRKPSYTSPRMLQIGVDVLQTVRDAAPAVLLRTTG